MPNSRPAVINLPPAAYPPTRHIYCFVRQECPRGKSRLRWDFTLLLSYERLEQSTRGELSDVLMTSLRSRIPVQRKPLCAKFNFVFAQHLRGLAPPGPTTSNLRVEIYFLNEDQRSRSWRALPGAEAASQGFPWFRPVGRSTESVAFRVSSTSFQITTSTAASDTLIFLPQLHLRSGLDRDLHISCARCHRQSRQKCRASRFHTGKIIRLRR